MRVIIFIAILGLSTFAEAKTCKVYAFNPAFSSIQMFSGLNVRKVFCARLTSYFHSCASNDVVAVYATSMMGHNVTVNGKSYYPSSYYPLVRLNADVTMEMKNESIIFNVADAAVSKYCGVCSDVNWKAQC